MNRYDRIGVFDSGVGGLELLIKLESLMPCERIYYFADTVNNPYGDKTYEVIEKYLAEIIDGMLLRRVKLLVIACNTASVVFLQLAGNHPLKQKLKQAGVDVIPITTSQSVSELALVKPLHVTIVGTKLTVKSGVYEKLVKQILPDSLVLSLSAQQWVERIENPVADIAKEKVLRREAVKEVFEKEVAAKDAEAVILGCTHFPELENEIRGFVKDNCLLINPAESMAHFVKNYLDVRCLAADKFNGDTTTTTRVFTNGAVEKIEKRLHNLGVGDRFKVRKVDIRSDFSGKTIDIVGYGATGKSLIKYLAKQNPALLRVRDKNNSVKEQLQLDFTGIEIEAVTGDSYLTGAKHSDIIFRSPGVPAELPEFTEARLRGVPVMSDVELFLKQAPGKKVAISGTNGKTTTTILTRDLFANATKGNSHLVGNVGRPVLDDLARLNTESFSAIELSSFQLEELSSMPVDAAILLNITPDHLDRHGDMQGYVNAKGKIFTLLQENSYAIYNVDSETIVNDLLPKGCKAKMVPFSRSRKLENGAFIDGDDLVFNYDDFEELRLVSYMKQYKFSGLHNLENLMASALAAYLLGVKHSEIESDIRKFAGVSYRVELFYRLKAVDYFDDSKGTNPDATIKALEAMTKPVHLVAGGINKGIEFDEVALACKNCVKAVYLFDEITEPFNAAIADVDKNIECFEVADLEAATKMAYENAISGEAVLFSPACASPAGMKYYQRGNEFKSVVSAFGKNELVSSANYLADPLAQKK